MNAYTVINKETNIPLGFATSESEATAVALMAERALGQKMRIEIQDAEELIRSIAPSSISPTIADLVNEPDTESAKPDEDEDDEDLDIDEEDEDDGVGANAYDIVAELQRLLDSLN